MTGSPALTLDVHRPALASRRGADVRGLMEAAAGGDADAFAAVYVRYAGDVFRYLHRRVHHLPTTEDLTSEVFTAAWESSGRFTWTGTDPRAWLVSIARHTLAHHRRARRWYWEIVTDPVPEPRHVEYTPVAQVRAEAVRAAVDELYPSLRTYVQLRFFDDASVDEVAAAMGRFRKAIHVLHPHGHHPGPRPGQPGLHRTPLVHGRQRRQSRHRPAHGEESCVSFVERRRWGRRPNWQTGQ